MPESPAVTVVCPCYNEAAYIAATLDALLCQDLPPEDMEILIVDGGSSDGTRRIVSEYAERDPRIKLLDNPKRIVPSAMNIGIRAARGTYIVRVDSHAWYAPDYVSTCLRLLSEGRADNVGGNQTPEGTDWISSAIALASRSRFGAGNAAYKYSDEERYVDTVWLGAYERKTLEALGGYDEAFVINQDYELNVRLRASGGRILLSPSIRATYFVRPSIRKLARQYYRYGKGKVQTLAKHPKSLVWRQITAPALVAGLAASAATAPFAPPVAAVVPGTYAAANLAASTRIALREGLVYLPLLPIVFGTMHVAWGTGFWVGIVRHTIQRERPAEPAPVV